MEQANNSLNYFRKALIKKGHMAVDKASVLADRADMNWKRYKALLRSTGIEGMESLLKSLRYSSFSTCRSSSHHHYMTGTLEHSLGVYDELLKLAEGTDIDRKEIILAALLHDIGKGYDLHGKYPGLHPERSEAVVRHFLKDNVSHEVLNAIRHHLHHSRSHLLQNLLCTADHKDAAKCNSHFRL